MTPLYTPPKPPSPIIRDRLKFLVAVLSSANEKTLRLLGLGDALVNDIPTEDPVLMSETFRELYSEPDLLTSGSVDVEVEERTEIDLVVFGSSFVSVFENEKHLIALNFASSPTANCKSLSSWNHEKTNVALDFYIIL